MRDCNVPGKWSDNLGGKEVEFTKKCVNCLSDENSHSWDDFLNIDKVVSLTKVIPNSNRSDDELIAMKSIMFEIRFAYLVCQSGLSALYEFQPNAESAKTVDFKVYGKKIGEICLLIELTSLRESRKQKKRTSTTEAQYDRVPVTKVVCDLGEDEEVNEYCKAQNVLVEKAQKYPKRKVANQFNVVIVDMRSSILGGWDNYDSHNVLYGSNNLNGYTQRHMKNGMLFPGIFSSAHPEYHNEKFVHLRNSIHYFGFVVEKHYASNELATAIQWFKNPGLIDDKCMLDLRVEVFNGETST